MKRSTIIETAKKYLGTPYHHQGRSKHGIDCAGLILCIAKDLNMVPPEYDWFNYSREPDGVSLIQEIEQWCTPTEQWQPGDLLVFKIKINPRHLAIATSLLDVHGMLHAIETADGRGKVCEHIMDQKWRDRIVAAYKFPGVED
jgi:cell wall-associated NlpC family hydrolase